MCRLAVYIGPQIPLSRLLLEPEYGLMQQSWAPKEMNEAKLNADGYGFSWFDADNKPASYRTPMPIWSDVNLESLGRTLSANQWFANVRSATLGLDVCHANTQPFSDNKFIFLHNGYIKNFNGEFRSQFQSLIDADHDKQIYGTTDSEYIFALIRQTVSTHPEFTIPEILRYVFKKIKKIINNSSALLNIVIGDNTKVYASRHAINASCPSLYYNLQEAQFPDGQLLVSEPFNNSPGWQAVPEHHIITLDGTQQPQLLEI
jgi:glutamine amidotransferase